MNKKLIKEALDKIAQTELGIDQLEERFRDRLDFYELHVKSIEKALREAFNLGTQVGVACALDLTKRS